MAVSRPARRIPVPDTGETVLAQLSEPGDYCGPIAYPDDGTRSVWFLLPCARDEDVDPRLRSVCRVAEPPHRFRECPDGSLEIRESIAVLGRNDGQDVHLWHGYLDEGNTWREA